MTATLGELVAAQGPLTTGQVVTVGVQIARELAMLHAAGHVYARVSADEIRIGVDGRPSLAPATSGGGEPADDVEALARLLREAAGSNAGLALLRVLGASTDAVTLARDLYAVCAPEPVLARSLATTQRRPLRRLRLVVVLATATATAGLVGVAWAHSAAHPSARAVPRPTAPPTRVIEPDWTAVMAKFDATRDAAFAVGNAGALMRVYLPGTRALTIETASVRALASRHVHARGLHLQLVSVRVGRRTPNAVTLDVVDRLPAYDIVDANRRVVTHNPGRGPRKWQVELKRADGGWRISRIA
jgi:hypothetical protein